MALELEPWSGGSERHADHASGSILLGLVNNMPDAALESTEAQFRSLLAASCGQHRVRLRITSLPDLPRGAQARTLIETCYWPLDRLLGARPDALIVTGTEPKSARLRDEPYWRQLAMVIDHAANETVSSVFSCLAAHAAVLHLDSVERRRLPEKRFGVFAQEVLTSHGLLRGLGPALHTPHSRWNDLPAKELQAAGYQVLSGSEAAGVDAFIREGKSLLLMLQGHPEYEDKTLLKEYQRDVARFLAGEQSRYPSLPAGYFSSAGEVLLAQYAKQVAAGVRAGHVAPFPFVAVSATLNNNWSASAQGIYRNWLATIAERKAAVRRS